ncbi:MAG: 2-phosphosulfolactate phosphatase [Sediminibacterium sp.]|nr:2-phosphosulfolactate phosphatase [Sediminibacterium sp.]
MNKPNLFTIITPRLLDLYDIQNSVVVVIDVFRATSSIAVALHRGCKAIYPVDDVEYCKKLAAELNALSAGEQDGKIIPGLQYGNSPSDFKAELVADKELVLTTTNGTKLIHLALKLGAQEIITGSFVNLSAVVDYIIKSNKNIYLCCAGWKNRFNLEDFLFAGAVLDVVEKNFTIQCDSSLAAKQMYQLHKNNLKQFIQLTTHWHRLNSYNNVAEDLLLCVTPDFAPVLPKYDGVKLIQNQT